MSGTPDVVAGSPDVIAWREKVRADRAGHHGMNVWTCSACGFHTFSIDVDPGATPLVLRCRNPRGCNGDAITAGYPDDPPTGPREPEWEWRLPTVAEFAGLHPSLQSHISAGGLLLAPRESGRPSAYLVGAAS